MASTASVANDGGEIALRGLSPEAVISLAAQRGRLHLTALVEVPPGALGILRTHSQVRLPRRQSADLLGEARSGEMAIDDRHSLAELPFTALSLLELLRSVVSSRASLMATAPSLTSAVCRHRLTVSAYERMADAGIISPDIRVELINGEILDISPIGSLHAAVVSRLVRDFIVAIGDAAIVRAQDPLRLDDFNEPEPDLAILTPNENFYASCHPGPCDTLLVVEVADTSLEHDMTTKAAVYAGAGIREYWVVDLSSRSVAILSDPRDGTYETRRTYRGSEPLAPAGLPQCLVDPLVMLRRL